MSKFKMPPLCAIFSLVFAYMPQANVCNASNPFWKGVSETSGCLQRPILLIHGLGKSGTFWGESRETPNYVSASVADNLSRYFLTSQTSIADRDHNGIEFFNGIDQAATPIMADLIADRVGEVLTEYYGVSWRSNPKIAVDIIAHSQGGVAIREALYRNIYGNTLSNPLNHIHHIITMGSPHLGTSVTLTNSAEFPGLISAKNLLRGTETPRIDGNAWYGPFVEISVWSYGLYGTYRAKIDGNTKVLFNGSKFQPWGQSVLAKMESLGPDLQKGSSLINNLTSIGFPRRSLDNGFVPMTAMYSTVSPQFLNDLIAPHWKKFREEIVSTGGEYMAGEEASEILSEMWGDIDPYVKGFDRDWSANSDLVVETSSATGSGLFSSSSHPFQSVNLGSGILHGSWRNPTDDTRITGQENVASPALISSLQVIPQAKEIARALNLFPHINASTNHPWFQNFLDSRSGYGSLSSNISWIATEPVTIKFSASAKLSKLSFSYKLNAWDLSYLPRSFKVVNENTGALLWSTNSFSAIEWNVANIPIPANTTNIRIEFSGMKEVKMDDFSLTIINISPVVSLLLN